jgi:hypothetical protein
VARVHGCETWTVGLDGVWAASGAAAKASASAAADNRDGTFIGNSGGGHHRGWREAAIVAAGVDAAATRAFDGCKCPPTSSHNAARTASERPPREAPPAGGAAM